MTRHLQGVIERIRQQIKLDFAVQQVYFTAPTFVTREVSARMYAGRLSLICMSMFAETDATQTKSTQLL